MSDSIDAPTTLPSLHRVNIVERIGGIVTSPLRALASLSRSDAAHPAEPLVIYALVVMAVHAAETYRYLSLATDAPMLVVRRLLDMVLRAGRSDLIVVACAAIIVGLIAQLRLKRGGLGAAVAVTYLLVPLALLKSLGGALSLAGVSVWALPHLAVDAPAALVVGGRVDWSRFVIKCVVSYAHGLVVLVAWIATMTKFREAPRAVVARAGAAATIAVMSVLILLAAGDVLQRKDTLRPKSGGDAFPSLSLPKLEGRGRLDPVSLVGDGKAKVLVVDFWASWCAPCKRSLPELSALADAYRDQGVVFLGVNREPTDVPAARESWKQIAPSFDSVIDNQGLGERLGLTSLPSSYIVDSEGKIRHLHLGYTEPSALKAELDALLSASR